METLRSEGHQSPGWQGNTDRSRLPGSLCVVINEILVRVKLEDIIRMRQLNQCRIFHDCVPVRFMPLITSTFSHLLDLRHAFISVVSIFLTIKMKFGVPDAFINLKAFFDVCFTCSTETVRYCDAVFHCLTSSLHLIINVFSGWGD